MFLGLWLAAFAVQTTDLIAAVAPDSCTEEAGGAPNDTCPEDCPSCVCCARVPVCVPPGVQPINVGLTGSRGLLAFIDPSTTPSPQGVFHVPKNFLT